MSRNKGVEVLARGFFPVHDDNERSRITYEAFEAAAKRVADDHEIEGLFVSCTALCTAKVVNRLEQVLDKPVVTSNQALAWDALRIAGDKRLLRDRGRLFRI